MPRDADFNRHLRADIDDFSLHAAVRRGADLLECTGDPSRPGYRRPANQVRPRRVADLDRSVITSGPGPVKFNFESPTRSKMNERRAGKSVISWAHRFNIE
jgi:hypothetical protein